VQGSAPRAAPTYRGDPVARPARPQLGAPIPSGPVGSPMDWSGDTTRQGCVGHGGGFGRHLVQRGSRFGSLRRSRRSGRPVGCGVRVARVLSNGWSACGASEETSHRRLLYEPSARAGGAWRSGGGEEFASSAVEIGPSGLVELRNGNERAHGSRMGSPGEPRAWSHRQRCGCATDSRVEQGLEVARVATRNDEGAWVWR
jgi:hypothetical protein